MHDFADLNVVKIDRHLAGIPLVHVRDWIIANFEHPERVYIKSLTFNQGKDTIHNEQQRT